MLDIKLLRDNPELVRDAMRRRHQEAPIDEILELDKRRRELLTDADRLRAEVNSISKQVGRTADADEREKLKEQSREIGERLNAIDPLVAEVEARQRDLLLRIPNIPMPEVPDGKDSEDNLLVRSWGEPPQFDFEPQAHWDIGPRLGIMDFERAAKLSGSRFTILRGMGAQLELALINFMVDMHTREHGYQLVWPPYLITEEAMIANGQLPKFEDGLYSDKRDGLYLISTAESALASMYMGEIMDEAILPLKLVAYTPCFRRESGSSGQDVRGYLRQHQFSKVELFAFTKPEESPLLHEALTRHAERVLQELGLAYRVMLLCTGDITFSSAKTYDLEVWLPGQNTYREISSCSNVEDFQARRSNTRYRDANGRVRFPHMLNGSGLAVGRTLLAILENYQQADGTVVIPE
ncbi:MAG: serine--tRNA ligase, partial [Candidatus Chloroheliales bacterium]